MKKLEVEFPINRILFEEGILLLVIVGYWIISLEIPIWTLIVAIIYVLIVYLRGQKIYTRLMITDEKIVQIFMYSFYLSSKEYLLKDIEKVVFQFHAGLRGIPTMRIVFKDGNERIIMFPKFELDQIRDVLKESGVRILNAQYLGHRP